eukprot:7234429-Prorocentrum_lima.AAC.1
MHLQENYPTFSALLKEARRLSAIIGNTCSSDSEEKGGLKVSTVVTGGDEGQAATQSTQGQDLLPREEDAVRMDMAALVNAIVNSTTAVQEQRMN